MSNLDNIKKLTINKNLFNYNKKIITGLFGCSFYDLEFINSVNSIEELCNGCTFGFLKWLASQLDTDKYNNSMKTFSKNIEDYKKMILPEKATITAEACEEYYESKIAPALDILRSSLCELVTESFNEKIILRKKE